MACLEVHAHHHAAGLGLAKPPREFSRGFFPDVLRVEKRVADN
jgi:hypothetical protein